MLMGLLSTIAASMVAKVLVSIGFSVVTFVGMGFVISGILDTIQGQVSLVPAAALQAMALVKLDVAINIIVSAATLKLGFFSFDGLISKINFNPPAP